MTERPIIFSGDEVRAILAGTQTRRIVKPQPPDDWNPRVGTYHPTKVNRDGEQYPGQPVFGASDESFGVRCPFGVVGSRLWVRETWCQKRDDSGYHVYNAAGDLDASCCWYRASHPDVVQIDDEGGQTSKSPWSPSIHMPRWASRITLEITGVRVERLQEISEADALSLTEHGIDNELRINDDPEGKEPQHFPVSGTDARIVYDIASGMGDLQERHHGRLAQIGFATLWQSLYGPDSWAANPWVWVVTFRRVTE